MDSFKEAFIKIASKNNNSSVEPVINNDDFEDTIRKLAFGRELVLYGGGTGGYSTAYWLQQLRIQIDGICDTYRRGVFPITGQTIMTPVELYEKHFEAIILITTSQDFVDEIISGLINMGFPAERIIPFALPLAPPPRIPVEEFQRTHYSGYEWAYSLLADSLSQSVLLGIVQKYLLGLPILRSSDSPQYFENGIIRLEQNEVFIDGGAFTGDTATLFIKQCDSAGVRYNRIWSFEPDPELCDVYRRELTNFLNIEIMSKGLWSSDTELIFTRALSSGASSVTNNSPGEKFAVPVIALDNLFADKPYAEWPTFIKMDIEGAEQEALKGARRIICEKRPKLAICVYHKPDDLYEIMRILHELQPDYRFILRQCHGDGYNEQVLYAIPN